MLHQVATKTSHAVDKLTDRQRRIYQFLQANPIGVLSSITPDGDPHGAVIYFAIDENFCLSFLTKSDTRKYDNLHHHRHVMLTVFEPRSQSTAQITGEVVEVKDDLVLNQIAGRVQRASIKTSDASLPPIAKLQAGAYVAFRIKPVQIRMAVYSRPNSGEYSDLFESIESFQLNDCY